MSTAAVNETSGNSKYILSSNKPLPTNPEMNIGTILNCADYDVTKNSVGNASVTPLWLQMSMDGGTYQIIIAMIYTKPEWYTPAEVSVHNRASDCWVSLNGKVYDLTSWLEDQVRLCRCVKSCSCPIKNWYCGDDCVEYCTCIKRGFFYCDAKRLAMTIVAFAGKDVSYWFSGNEWVTYIHPITGTRVPYMPHGHGLRQPVVPSTKWRPENKPWWLNDDYVIGKVTAKTRPIRIVNTLIGSTVTLEVCSEETLYQIMMRYLPHNSHMHSYTWRYLGRGLCYNKSLEENGIPDEREIFNELAMPENNYVPSILVYYNDDLTEDPPRDDCYCYEMACLTRPVKPQQRYMDF